MARGYLLVPVEPLGLVCRMPGDKGGAIWCPSCEKSGVSIMIEERRGEHDGDDDDEDDEC